MEQPQGKKAATTSTVFWPNSAFAIKAVYEDERGGYILWDTPGIIGVSTGFSKKINESTLRTLNESVDIVIYMVDHTENETSLKKQNLGPRAQIKPT